MTNSAKTERGEGQAAPPLCQDRGRPIRISNQHLGNVFKTADFADSKQIFLSTMKYHLGTIHKISLDQNVTIHRKLGVPRSPSAAILEARKDTEPARWTGLET